MRILYEEKASTFNVQRLPFIKGYFPESYIQYNESTQHFRTVKVFGKSKLCVIDQGERTEVQGELDRKKVIESVQWTNYVVIMKNVFWEGRQED